MEMIEKDHIQGMLLYGYRYLPIARYLFLSITDPSKMRVWLQDLDVQYATASPREKSFNIAFTPNGLRELGVPITEENGFSRAFLEGMDTEHRNRILGDFGANASSRWNWGHRNDEELHLVLMAFGKDKVTIEQWYQGQSWEAVGLCECHEPIESETLPRDKEHFGFRDGISQPVIRGLGRESSEDNYINAGEFILGYQNEYLKMPHSPYIREDQFDFGRNGSYMVFRQLEQNVPLFWNTVCAYFGGKEAGKQQGIELASKMVGRWPNGNPLMEDAAVTLDTRDLNDFSFHLDDPQGTHCPLGSHIRRTNPRDSLSNSDKQSSLQRASDAANKHRILRRGRPYGKPVDENMLIEKILEKVDGDVESRGLNFICFNSDIDRQFEFVQQTWSNNMKFHNLYADVDPIIGVQNGGKDKAGNYQMAHTQFEAQARPVRKRYRDIPPFVQVKGGSYFFMPGRKTIEYLTNQQKHDR